MPAWIEATCSATESGLRSFWFNISTNRSPRASCFCVSGSSSEPNCANASRSRYWERSRRSLPATFFIAFVCALPPTRETEIPTLIAGRTPE